MALGKKYVRVVEGKEVQSSNNFDKLQSVCDKDMEGYVLSSSDYYAIRLNMISELKEKNRLVPSR